MNATPSADPLSAHTRSAEVLRPHGPFRQVDIWSALSAATLVAAACCNLVDVSGSGVERVQLSGQVMIKLVIATLAMSLGGWALLSQAAVRRVLTTPPGLLLVGLAGVLLLSSSVAIAEVANVSRFAALNFLASVVFVAACTVRWGVDRVAGCVWLGGVLFLVGSWGAYWWVPSVGVFVEQLSPNFQVSRMGGLAHPNGLGRVAMLTAILSLALVRQPTRHRWLLITVGLLAIATAAIAFSRTAILAGLVALLVLYMDLVPTRRGVVAVLTAISLGLLGLLFVELATGSDVLGRLLVSAGTKTGHVEELTTATGRTDIWRESLRLISLRPLCGYGLNSAPILLTEFSQHTHNILLHPTLSGGVLAGLLMAAVLLWNLTISLRSSHPLIRSVAAFVLVSGLFEDTVLGTFPGPPTILWLMATLYPALPAGKDNR